MGFWDNTEDGIQRVGTIPGLGRIEIGETTIDVSTDQCCMATTLTRLYAGFGHLATDGSFTGSCEAISICADGPVICFTINDLTSGTVEKFTYVAFGA